VAGKRVAVHRLAWEFSNGEIPQGMFVCHRCDNPKCFEVSHLFLGTAADNMADKIAKGRGRGGRVTGTMNHNHGNSAVRAKDGRFA
jgi:hypothetical protein